MKYQDIFSEYISGLYHMSLATSVDGRPWVCEVHFVYDDDYNLYFRSLASRRHCQEIAANPQVAGNIVEQHGLGQKPRGIYFEGTAAMVTDDAVNQKLIDQFVERLGLDRERVVADFQAEDGAKLYKITTSDWYMFDVRDPEIMGKVKLT